MSLIERIFPPNYIQAWQRFSHEIGAEYVKKFWSSDQVVAKVGEWTITLDTYSSNEDPPSMNYTRIRAPYVSKDGLEFAIQRRTFISKIADIFGMQDIKVGVPILDEVFIIRGNNTEKIKRLFSIPQIHEKIEIEPDIYLSARDDDGFLGALFPENVDELYLRVDGVVCDLERLKDLYRLFIEVLNQLYLMGSAGQEDSEVDLD